MPRYRVSLLRSYSVVVTCDNEENAKQIVEFYLNSSTDGSTTDDQVEDNFSIEEIEMVENTATGCEEIGEPKVLKFTLK